MKSIKIKKKIKKLLFFPFCISYFFLVTFVAFAHPWGELAELDLQSIRENLALHSAPAASKDKAFLEWLKAGLDKGLIKADQASTYAEYVSILKTYIQGFHEGHIELQENFLPIDSQAKYPGILLKCQGENFVIGYKDETREDLSFIPLGTKVITIDTYRAMDFAVRHSRKMGTGNLEADMIRLAPYLLVDRGDPFSPPPATCILEIEGKKVQLPLYYKKLPERELNQICSSLSFAPPHPLSLQEEGNGSWISLPTFFLKEKAAEDMRKIMKLLPRLRNKEWIVFDLRGNEGGASIWQRPILRNFYGDVYLKSLGIHHYYNQPWLRKIRATLENYEFFKQNASALEKAEFKDALQKKEEFYTEEFSIYEGSANLFSSQDNQPVRASVYVLTDGLCYSSCWHFVHEMRQIPGVVHVGSSIGPYTPYGYSRPIQLPSGLFDLFIPIHKTESPTIVYQHTIKPHYIYTGDWSDRAATEKWVLELIKDINTKK